MSRLRYQITEEQLRANIVERAQADIGQGEVGGNNMGPFVAQQMQGTGLPTQGPNAAWCTAWLTRVVGEATPGVLGRTANSRALAGQFSSVGALSKIAPDGSNVRAGDVIVMPRTDGNTTGAHSAIVESVGGGRINTIEGNINRDGSNSDRSGELQGVYRKSYTVDELRQLTRGAGLGVGDVVQRARSRGIAVTPAGQSPSFMPNPFRGANAEPALPENDTVRRLAEAADIPTTNRLEVSDATAIGSPQAPNARTQEPLQRS